MERFGRYVLLQRVGKGGMAEVFRGANLGAAGFARQVAVKRILPHLTAIKEFLNMFIDEARIASRLNHPGILPVLDLGEEQGSYFMAMEYVAGGTLRMMQQSVARRKILFGDGLAVHVALAVLAALEHAHGRRDATGRPLGIVHRDVSPHNIMLGFDGRVLLGDFGIARARDRLVHTISGGVKGKFGYMAPEQAMGAACDQRADLYAVGAILYELCTGKPFRSMSNTANLIQAASEGLHVPVEKLRPALHPGLIAVIRKALAADADDRFQDAASMREPLLALQRREGWILDGNACAEFVQKMLPERRAAEDEAQAYFDAAMASLSHAMESTQDGVGNAVTAIDMRALSAPPAFPDEEPSIDALPEDDEGTQPALPALPVLDPTRPLSSVFQSPSARAAAEPTIIEAPPQRPPTQLAPPPPPRRKRIPLGAAVAAGLGGFALTLAALWVIRSPAPPPRPPPVTTEKAPPRVPEPPPPARQEPASPPEPIKEPEPTPDTDPPVESRRKPEDRRKPPPREPQPQTGMLSVQAYPWARIILDGADLGAFTPLVNHKLSAGRHVLELHNDEEKVRWRTEVIIRPGKTTSVTKRFTL